MQLKLCFVSVVPPEHYHDNYLKYTSRCICVSIAFSTLAATYHYKYFKTLFKENLIGGPFRPLKRRLKK